MTEKSFGQTRNTRYAFALGVIAVLVLAAVPRFISYDFSLPYIDHVDEPMYYLHSLDWLHGSSNVGDYFVGYPPGYLVVGVGALRLAEFLGLRGGGEFVRILRFLSVIMALLTILFLSLTARNLSNDLGGLISGLVWGIAPILLRETSLAIQDPVLYMWIAATLWLATSALRQPHPQWWVIASTICGIIAVLFKYPALPVLLSGLLLSLYSFRKDRKTFTRVLVIQCLLMIALAVFMYTQYVLLVPHHHETKGFASGGWHNLLNLSRVLGNYRYALFPLGVMGSLVIIGIGILFYLYAAPRLHFEFLTLKSLSLIAPLLVVPWIVSIYNDGASDMPDRIRDVLPGTLILCILFGISIAVITRFVKDRWGTYASLVPVGLLYCARALTTVFRSLKERSL